MVFRGVFTVLNPLSSTSQVGSLALAASEQVEREATPIHHTETTTTIIPTHPLLSPQTSSFYNRPYIEQTMCRAFSVTLELR